MKRALFPIGDYRFDRVADVLDDTGNFGVVYRALWVPCEKYVALKFVASDRGHEKVIAEERGAALQEEFARRFPDITPPVHEHGRSADGGYYISMELLDGEPLSKTLATERITHERGARIAHWIAAEFLNKLHNFHLEDKSAGRVVYADLKPEHIFLMRDGTLRVLDFGITKRVRETNTSTVNLYASIAYASPRRLRERVVDVDADFWALGIMLHEMIAGKHPYQALKHGPRAMLQRALERQDSPAPLPPCSEHLAAIVHKLLAPDREESYESASEIAEDLQAFLDGRAPSAARQRIGRSVPTAVVQATPRPRVAAGLTTPTTDPLSVREQDGAAPTAPPTRKRELPLGSLARAAMALAVVGLVLTEGAVWVRAENFRQRIGTIEADDVPRLRGALSEMRKWSLAGLAVPVRVHGALGDRLVALGERPILDYRTDLPVVTKLQWQEAEAVLALARELKPGHAVAAARERYVQAHVLRIDAGTQRIRLEGAVAAFREAARLDPSWPDPYLGLARIHAYDLKDFDALAEDLREAMTRGHREGRRERAQLGDGYRFRADRLRLRAQRATGDDRRWLLQDAADDYQNCAAKFAGLNDFLNSDRNLAYCRTHHARLKARLDEKQ